MNMSCLNTSKTLSPATEALERSLNMVQSPVLNKEKPMICTKNLKRSRSGFGLLDMSAFEEASKQVEDSIAFPSIEWSFDDEDSEDDFASPPYVKRRCRGLSRSSDASFDLASMSSQRLGSSGSLC
jgi:hypothetical protein